MTRAEARFVLDGWYRFSQNERIVGGYLPSAGTGEYDTSYQSDDDVLYAELVNRVLSEIGKGAYAPREVVRLLQHVCRCGSLEGFSLFGLNEGLQKEIIGLGYRSDILIELAYRRVVRRLCKEPLPVAKRVNST